MNYDSIISPAQLQAMLEQNEEPIIIDLREQILFFNPLDKAKHIPASQISKHISKLSKAKNIILYCSHGVDSFFIMNMLKIDYGFEKVYSLKGGIETWYQFKQL